MVKDAVREIAVVDVAVVGVAGDEVAAHESAGARRHHGDEAQGGPREEDGDAVEAIVEVEGRCQRHYRGRH